jgi:serine/threonine protein phosphatase PrpC
VQLYISKDKIHDRGTEVFMYQLDFAAQVDLGLVRQTNQDVARVVPSLGLALVADGMGGHLYGDLASRIAADAFQRGFEQLGGVGVNVVETKQRLLSAFHSANERVCAHNVASKVPRMGTTLVAAIFAYGYVLVAHAGDSRCYRLRGRDLDCLTQDHSYAAEFRRQGLVNTPELKAIAERWGQVLTRFLGESDNISVDLWNGRGEPGDVFMLCSDGLWNAVAEDAVVRVLAGTQEARDACYQLINRACADGGRDNIAVAVVRLNPLRLRLEPPLVAQSQEAPAL